MKRLPALFVLPFSRPRRRAATWGIPAALLLAAPLVTPLLCAPTAHAAIVERVVAVVGEDAIFLTDLKERAMPYLLRVYQSVPEGPQRAASISQVYDFVLQAMVDEQLEGEAARKAGVEVTDEQVNAAIQQTATQNQLTVNQMLIEAKRSGLSEKNYREELRRQLIQRTMMELRLRGRIQVNEQDIKAAYRRLTLEERMQLTQRTVQLRLSAGSGASERTASKKKADAIVAEARGGADFRDLIKKHSTDSASGLRPPAPPFQEPKDIQRATMALEVGEVSEPILIGQSWVILKVIERPPSQLPPYVEARAEVHERVYMEKLSAERKHWLEGLRRRTHVDIRL